jgi:signal peptidase I
MESTPQGSPETPRVEPPSTDKHELRREVLDFVKLVAWFLIIFLGLRAFVVEGYEVQGESMGPTLENNERILVLKLPHQLAQWGLLGSIDAIDPGDIVVFESPDNAGKRYVKRVIAMGAPARRGVGSQAAHAATQSSRRVLVTFDRGDVFVNNQKLDEPYLPESARVTPDRQEVALDPGDYYVLGDNRAVSKDSRSFEAVSDDVIIGKAVLRFWPPSKISLIR